MDRGGVVEAFVRAVMYVARPAGRVDERGFAALQEVAAMLPPDQRPGLARFKEIVREQSLALELDEERAIRALPRLAPGEEDRRRVLGGLDHLLSYRPPLTADQQARLRRVKSLLHTSASKRAPSESTAAEG